jgi:hypothetical protein
MRVRSDTERLVERVIVGRIPLSNAKVSIAEFKVSRLRVADPGVCANARFLQGEELPEMLALLRMDGLAPLLKIMNGSGDCRV